MVVDFTQLQLDAEQIAPNARLEEREAALILLDLGPKHVVCDVPSWLGYFARGVPGPKRVICLDRNPMLVNCPGARVMMSAVNRFPLAAGNVDRLVSLAGLHHHAPVILRGFLREVARVLRSTGVAVASEVLAGSPVAEFLNQDVNKYSTRGHKGTFFGVGGLKAALEEAGLSNVVEETVPLSWRFSSLQQMAAYCRALFAMTLATEQEVLEVLRARFMVTEQDGQVCLPWTLLYAVGTKP